MNPSMFRRTPILDPTAPPDPNDPTATPGGGTFNEKAPISPAADPSTVPPPPSVAAPRMPRTPLDAANGLGGGAAADAINQLLGLHPGQSGAAMYYPGNHTIGLTNSYLVEHPGADWEQVQRSPEGPKSSGNGIVNGLISGLSGPSQDGNQSPDMMAQIMAELQAQQDGGDGDLTRQAQMKMLQRGQ